MCICNVKTHFGWIGWKLFRNFFEIVHNKWLQQFDNRGSYLYVATVDDYVRASSQSTNYSACLKGNMSITGSDKDELKLRVARCSSGPQNCRDC